ncbi:hypothetical protein [uncultured Maribacter sp.]|uniref:hypothetical protein n=1 Tax=uncultured Maribacter sp. TaxID=431308 RepID=UPI00262C0707|nr:hypothetical protein [uncultured Maribacter sp.]
MKNLLLILLFIYTNLVIGQIKIGDNPEILDTNSLLELESDSKVLVISRMSEAQILALTPLQGAMVYNTDASCIFYFDGSNWNNLCEGGSTGAISWGNITGTITDQADLVTELQNYVDLTTAQNIAGEKTLTEKFTVNTGDTSAQIAEFLGRVKGENAVDPEDFITKFQLDTLSTTGSATTTWADITGDIVDNTDLTTELANYVNLTTAQNVAGEKTLTEKFTVNTGDTSAQIAEFLGRVKGENGTEDEDFATMQQLNAVSAGALTGTPGSIFFADDYTEPTVDNANLFWDEDNKQLRVGDNSPPSGTNELTTLNLQGSISTPIGYPTTLTEEHHTTIIDWSTWVTLPNPETCVGRIYIIKTSELNKNNPSETTRVRIRNNAGYNASYYDTGSVERYEFPPGTVTQIQSSGTRWEQIN